MFQQKLSLNRILMAIGITAVFAVLLLPAVKKIYACAAAPAAVLHDIRQQA